MEERMIAMLEKHHQDLSQRLDSIEEQMVASRQSKEREVSQMDRFQNKLIALEASLEEKLGLWKENLLTCSETVESRRL